MNEEVLNFQMSALERSLSAQSCSSVSWEQNMANMKHKNFCVYQRRTWDEFKRVLSVTHVSQPVERAESLEYRNQLSGVCWRAVYFWTESIFLNHTVHQVKWIENKVYIYIYVVIDVLWVKCLEFKVHYVCRTLRLLWINQVYNIHMYLKLKAPKS